MLEERVNEEDEEGQVTTRRRSQGRYGQQGYKKVRGERNYS